MTATELRIGNYVQLLKGNTFAEEVNGIFIIDEILAIYFLSDNDGLKYLKPIPITKEWLKRFGFKGHFSTRDLLFSYGVCFQQFQSELYLVGHGGDKKLIKYVHEAQNIYFALTGKELEIKC